MSEAHDYCNDTIARLQLQVGELRAELKQAHDSHGYEHGMGPCVCKWCAEKPKCDMSGPCEEGHVCGAGEPEKYVGSCWFAEVNQESKDACSECRGLTWPKPGWIHKDGSYLTSDPHKAKRFNTRDRANDFSCMTHVRHWHLYPTEHVFMEKRKSEVCEVPVYGGTQKCSLPLPCDIHDRHKP